MANSIALVRKATRGRRAMANGTGCSTLLFLALCACLSGPCGGMKHQYWTKHDGRSLIAPLGFPYGFLEKGYYNLTVFDFNLDISDHTEEEHKNAATEYYNGERRGLNEALEGVRGVGFLLKRFDDESEFNKFIKVLESDPEKCAFEEYLPGDDDTFKGLDDDDYKSTASEPNAAAEGIFLSMMNQTGTWGGNRPWIDHTFVAGEAGLYFLIYQICPTPNKHVHSRFELDFNFVNIDMFGNDSFLSSGEMFLPHMYFYFSLFYMICAYLWISNIKKIKAGEPGHFENPEGGIPVVYPIHSVMSALLVLKLLSVFFESIRYHYIRVSGHAELWTGVFYMFSFLKGAFLFTVILLIGSGWSFVKPFLSNRERNMILVVLALQFVNNVAIIVLSQETEGEKSFDGWTAALHMVDILCCCAVLMPIVNTVNNLEKNAEQSNGEHDDSEADLADEDDDQVPEDEFENVALAAPMTSTRNENSRLASKLRLFRSFYLLVVAYIYMTRIVVYLFASVLSYRYLWVKEFVVEGVTLAFYCLVGMMFRPMVENRNPYQQVPAGNGVRSKTEIELT